MTTMINADGRPSFMTKEKAQKMMRLAKFIGEDNTSCLGRKVGTVIADKHSVVISCGFNGPARGLPHADTYDFLSEFLYPKLTEEEKKKLVGEAYKGDFTDKYHISSYYEGCGKCPRRLLGYSSGERAELCYCQHSESNAIIFAQKPLKDSILFCWCNALSCLDCSGKIINAGIGEVHFLEGKEFQSGALWMYKKAGIPVFRHSVEDF